MSKGEGKALDTAARSLAVCERLTTTPGIKRLPVASLDLFLLREFLSRDECDDLIGLIEAERKPSKLMADSADPTLRTSETCNLDPKNPVVRYVEAKLAVLLGIDPLHGENLQGQRYGVGQQFKPHHDYLRTDAPYWPKQEKIGGQRTWTAMIFLNVPSQGGETQFPLVRVRIPPRQGTLVTWNNLQPDGKPNPDTLHQGLPVIAGVKYIITKWFRERPWGGRRRASPPRELRQS